MIPSHDPLTLRPPGHNAESRFADVHAELQKLEARDWWLWSLAVVVMLLLTFAVFSLNFPELAKQEPTFVQIGQSEAVRGLIALVVLFNAYTIYQRILVKRLRKRITEKFAEMVDLEARAKEFQKLSLVDPLTGLYNRRLAEDRIAAEISRSSRYKQPLTLLALDLDGFKQVNDTYGHAAGDLILIEFAARLNSAIRLSDLAARMGGDEFLVLLTACPLSYIDTILERLAEVEVEHDGRKISVGFSAGWVEHEQGETLKQFLERADQALYECKRRSKARIPQEPLRPEVRIH